MKMSLALKLGMRVPKTSCSGMVRSGNLEARFSAGLRAPFQEGFLEWGATTIAEPCGDVFSIAPLLPHIP